MRGSSTGTFVTVVERSLWTAAKQREAVKAQLLDEKSCKPSATAFAGSTELYGGGNPGLGIFGMTDNVTETDFDAALEAAKEERNLSRALRPHLN